jgi:hypothetical protein
MSKPQTGRGALYAGGLAAILAYNDEPIVDRLVVGTGGGCSFRSRFRVRPVWWREVAQFSRTPRAAAAAVCAHESEQLTVDVIDCRHS